MPAQGSFQPSQTVAGRYRINTFLGGGETAEVYRAIDLVSGRDVALKVLCAGAPKDVELRASREFYYLSRFAHPGIVTALDFGTTPDGRPYFTTEFFDGRPFPEFFARGYERKLVDAAIQVLGALDAIHAQGLVHCDIKPANLLVQERDGNVMARLLDFGFAESISMSEPGEQRGTLGYVAPEVFKGIDPDARADLYSLGMVLYETITRRGPGVGSSLREWLKKQYYTDFEPPRSFDSQIPEEFEAVVLSLLRREPERRPRSAMAVIAELAGPGWQAATSDAPRRFLMAPGFIGRSTETDRLKTLLTGASRGRAGVICVSGERGVGKSRLLSEFRFLAQLEGATILACEPGSLGARQQSLIESVIGYLKLYLPSSVASVEESRAALSEETKYRLFEAVTQGLRELAASPAVKHSLVLLVDDFELFDPTSLEFLRYLAFSIDADRLVVLVAGLKEKRFLDLVGELERKSHFYHLSVTSMDHRDVDALVSSLLGPVPGVDELVDWMMRVTGGNPLFVIETVYALIDAKILLMRGTRWSIATELLEAYRPPDTVTEVVRRRLNNLTHEELEVLQVGAASAGPFTVDFLRAVLGFAENDLFNAIARLKSLGLLRNFAANHQSALILSSKILEAAVTERLSVVQRRENHRRVAQAMERLYADRLDELVFELAHHYTQAGIKDRAYAYLLKAGARARELRLTEQALSNFEVALAMSAQTVTPRERVGLIETVGTLREATGRYADAIEVYTQGISVVVADPELSADRPLMARFLQRMGHVHQKQARHADSINYFNQALLMQPDRTSVGYVDLLNDLGWSYCSAGNMARSEELLTQAMQLVEKLKATDPGAYLSLSARTFYYFSYLAWSRFDYVLALQLAERSLDGYESAHDELYMGHVSQFIAMLWWRRGDLAKAREYYERHLAAQRRSGDTFFLIRALTGLGAICQDEGKWDDANDFSASALGLAERIGDINSMAALNSNIGLVCEVRGDWDRARGFFDRALELQERMERDSRNDRGQILANIGLLHAKRGEAYEAERVFDELQVLADASQDLGFRFEVALNRAYALLKAERHDPAIRMLARALWLVRRERGQREFSLVHTVAAELRLAAGEPVRAEVEAVRALSLLSGRKSSREYAAALRFHGLALCRLGRLEEGGAEIGRSIGILRQIGAKHELALSLLASAQSLTGRGPGAASPASPVSQQELGDALANLKEAQAILRGIGARPDADHCDDVAAQLNQLSTAMQLKTQERGEYLRVYSELSEMIAKDLGKDDFVERILDLVIRVTKAERGVLFLLKDDRLVPAAARDVDRTTTEDAESVSQSVLRRVRRRAEMVFSADAQSDARFNTANSVMLNKIRSLLCVPLRVDERVIGTVYLDSRVTAHLFLEEDKNLLASVANLLAATIDKSVAFRRLQEAISTVREDILVDAVTGAFLGKSRAIREVYKIIDRIAPTDCTVLLTGETGTGKGVYARLIHAKSDRRGNKFVAINCGALPETLFESELFGHARGAFTGAVRDKQGLFESAEGGTIFLDEISNTTPGIQAKLLQVLEDKVIRRVGETLTRRVDVRLVCATNRNLKEDVRTGKFREDLYYRVNVVSIVVPPLRERTEDIALLADYFVKRYANQLNKPVTGFDDAVFKMFSAYAWPGNVRELQNVIERSVIMTQARRVSAEDLGAQFARPEATPEQPKAKRRLLDRDEVVGALRQTDGNVSRAAELLDTHRRQLQRLIQRYRIDRTNVS